MIVDSRFYYDRLPQIIEAIADFGGGEERARDTHTRLLRHYGLSNDDVPLVRWNRPNNGFSFL